MTKQDMFINYTSIRIHILVIALEPHPTFSRESVYDFIEVYALL